MTITEYNASVRNKKLEMLEATDKNLNSQKEIAFVTLGESYGKFIDKARDIFEEFGFKVHWYHYTYEIMQELNMGIEIADLYPHYYKVFVFNDEIDWRFADAAFEVAMDRTPLRTTSVCIIGNDDRMAIKYACKQLELCKRIVAKPYGVGNVYSDLFEADMIFMFDRKNHINCYPIHKPLFKVFSWSTINDEDRPVYDMGEEIVLKVIENVCG